MNMEKKGSRVSKFNPDVLKEKDDNGDVIGTWCIAGSKQWEAICCLCNTTINCSNHGISAVKRHAKSSKHTEICKKNRKEDGTLKKPSQLRFDMTKKLEVTSLSQAEKTLSAEILFAFSSVYSNIPYNYGDIMSKIFSTMFVDSQIAKDFSCGRKKLSYMISDGIGLHIKEQLKNELRKSNAFFSIQMDETPIPEKRVKQLDINIRFFSEVEEEVISHHLESFYIGQATSEILFDKVKNILDDLPSGKLLNVFSDGPNVMKSLHRKIKEAIPNILDIGTCILHVIHNSFAKGLESFGGDIEELLIELYYFFKRSAVQSEELRNLQIDFGLPEHVLLRHVDSRWLTLHLSIDRFIEQFAVLGEFFSGKRETKCIHSTKYKKICQIFSSKTLLAKALFIRNVTTLFNRIQHLFQKQEPLIHILYDEHEQLLKLLMGRFLHLQSYSGVKDLTTVNIEKGDYWLQNAEVGADTEIELKNVSNNERKSFYLGARSFYISCTKYLLSKLPIKNKLLRNLKFLHPLYISEPSSVTCLKSVALFVPFIIPPEKVSSLIDEWISLQTEDLQNIICCKESRQSSINRELNSDDERSENEDDYNCDIITGQRIDHFWRNIFKMKLNTGSPKYKLLGYLVKSLLTLPHGNADCERGFAINKGLLEGRASLNIYSLNGLRQMKSHIKRLNYDLNKIKISRDLINAVKNSRQAYKKRLEVKNAQKQTKRTVSLDNTIKEIELEEKELQNKLTAAQVMLNLAESHIQDGLKKKDFSLIESGQVLLKDAREKIPILTQKIKDNKERMIKFKEQTSIKKRKI